MRVEKLENTTLLNEEQRLYHLLQEADILAKQLELNIYSQEQIDTSKLTDVANIKNILFCNLLKNGFSYEYIKTGDYAHDTFRMIIENVAYNCPLPEAQQILGDDFIKYCKDGNLVVQHAAVSTPMNISPNEDIVALESRISELTNLVDSLMTKNSENPQIIVNETTNQDEIKELQNTVAELTNKINAEATKNNISIIEAKNNADDEFLKIKNAIVELKAETSSKEAPTNSKEVEELRQMVMNLSNSLEAERERNNRLSEDVKNANKSDVNDLVQIIETLSQKVAETERQLENKEASDNKFNDLQRQMHELAQNQTAIAQNQTAIQLQQQHQAAQDISESAVSAEQMEMLSKFEQKFLELETKFNRESENQREMLKSIASEQEEQKLVSDQIKESLTENESKINETKAALHAATEKLAEIKIANEKTANDIENINTDVLKKEIEVTEYIKQDEMSMYEKFKAAHTMLYDEVEVTVIDPFGNEADTFTITIAPLTIAHDDNHLEIMACISNKYDTVVKFSQENSAIMTEFNETSLLIRGLFSNGDFQTLILASGDTAAMGYQLNLNKIYHRPKANVNYGHICYEANNTLFHIVPLESHNNNRMLARFFGIAEKNGERYGFAMRDDRGLTVAIGNDRYNMQVYWKDTVLYCEEQLC